MSTVLKDQISSSKECEQLIMCEFEGRELSRDKSSGKEKHEMKRAKLKNKRAREQLMQVVESFIRDQTILIVYTTYVQANLEYDIKVVHGDLFENGVQMCLRTVIQDVLKEIYISNNANVFIDGVIERQIRELSQKCLDAEKKEDKSNKLQLEEDAFGIFNLVLEQTLYNELKITCEEESAAILFEKLLERLMSEQIQQEDLTEEACQEVLEVICKETFATAASVCICSEDLVDSSLKGQILDQILETIIDQQVLPNTYCISNIIDEKIIEEELFSELIAYLMISEVAMESADEQSSQLALELGNKMISSVIYQFCYGLCAQEFLLYQIQNNAIFNLIIENFYECKWNFNEQKRILSTEIFENFYHSFTKKEVASILNYEVQLEYYSSISANKVVDSTVKKEVQEEKHLTHACISYEDDLIKSILQNILEEEVIPSVKENENCLVKESEYLVEQLYTRELIMTLAQESLSEAVFGNVEEKIISTCSQELIDLTSSNAILADQVFDNLLVGIINKDLVFQVKLLIDSREIRKQSADNVMTSLIEEIIYKEVIPLQIQSSIIKKELTCQSKQFILTDGLLNLCMEDLLLETIYQLLLETVIEVDKRQSTSLQQKHQKHTYPKRKSPPSTQRSARSQQMSTQEKDMMARYICSSFINQSLKIFAKEVVKEGVSTIVAEQIYKRIINKVVKRNLYHTIQQSVDAIYNLEEDTISLANQVLDGFILTEIDQLICEELMVTENSLMISHGLIENVTEREIRKLFKGLMKERGIKEKKTKKNEQQQVLYQKEKKHSQPSMKYERKGQNVQKDFSRYLRNSNNFYSKTEEDVDILSDEERGVQKVVISPSKVPILQTNLEPSSTFQKYQTRLFTVESTKSKPISIFQSTFESIPTQIIQRGLKTLPKKMSEIDEVETDGYTLIQNRWPQIGEFNCQQQNLSSSSLYQFMDARHSSRKSKNFKRKEEEEGNYLSTSSPYSHKKSLSMNQLKYLNTKVAKPFQERRGYVQEEDEVSSCQMDSDEDNILIETKQHPRIEEVKAPQPKEGIRFIEQKNCFLLQKQRTNDNIQFRRNECYERNLTQNLSALIGQNFTNQSPLSKQTQVDSSSDAQRKGSESSLNNQITKSVTNLNQMYQETKYQKVANLIDMNGVKSVRSSKSGASLNSKKSKHHHEILTTGTGNQNSANSVGINNLQTYVNQLKSTAFQAQKDSSYLQMMKAKKAKRNTLQHDENSQKVQISHPNSLNLSMLLADDISFIKRFWSDKALSNFVTTGQMPGILGQRQNLETCSEFQKKQFYLMALSQLVSRKIKLPECSLSIEELFRAAKVQKVHQKDWKEFIARRLQIIQEYNSCH